MTNVRPNMDKNVLQTEKKNYSGKSFINVVEKNVVDCQDSAVNNLSKWDSRKQNGLG